MPTPPPEQRFSDRVDDYIRFRPSYPPAVIDLLQRKARLTEDSIVADVGSGTGISAEMFLKLGCTVYGVEPNRGMREAAERQLSNYSAFRSVGGTAEATTLRSATVDLIVAAQAFHWFDPETTRSEWTRILKPESHVILIWNERRLDSTPFLKVYEDLLLTFGTDYTAVRHENINADRLRRFFLGGDYQADRFGLKQHFDFEGLKGRLLSSSYAPAQNEPGHDAMIDSLRRIFETHQQGGKVVFEYDTRVYIGR